MTYTPSVLRRAVGSALRSHREGAGYGLADAARMLDCDQSKISRIETGQRGISPGDLGKLLAAYDAEAGTREALMALAGAWRPGGWWKGYRRVLGGERLDIAVAESAASGICVYAPVQVPELLRTQDYAWEAASADAGVPEGARAAAVEAVVARRREVLAERGVEVSVILGEAALRQEAGGAGVLRGQLRYLAAAAGEYPRLAVRVLPFTAGAHAGGDGGGFSVLRFGPAAAGVGLAHVAGPGGGLCVDGAGRVAAYAETFGRLRERALSPEESARLLWQMAGTSAGRASRGRPAPG